MSKENPILLDLAKLKIFIYSQIDILANLKKMTDDLTNMSKYLAVTTENNIKLLQNLENASTLPDDPKISYYE